MYTEFAEVYDLLMKDVDYESWANYYISLIKKYNENATNIVECACGTGSLTKYFANEYNVIGVDISTQMLNIAKNKCQATFVVQDMKNLELHKPVDCVLATCDGVNYLHTKKELNMFFKSANKALKTNGLLIFDVSSKFKLKEYLPKQIWTLNDDKISYIWENTYQNNKLFMDLSIFLRQENNMYIKINEEQVQKCFEITEYSELLKNNGFKNIKIFGDKTYKSPSKTELRWHILAIKEQ